MSLDISERAFEDAIECGLLQHGPDDQGGGIEDAGVLVPEVPRHHRFKILVLCMWSRLMARGSSMLPQQKEHRWAELDAVS